MEHRRNDIDREKSKFSEEIVPLPLFHRKSRSREGLGGERPVTAHLNHLGKTEIQNWSKKAMGREAWKRAV